MTELKIFQKSHLEVINYKSLFLALAGGKTGSNLAWPNFYEIYPLWSFSSKLYLTLSVYIKHQNTFFQK